MGGSKFPDLGGAITRLVIGAAVTVHKLLGPGLEEADYEKALQLELQELGIEHVCQVPLPLVYKGFQLDCGYRMDLVVAGRLLLELKAIEKLHPIHEAQLLTYLQLSALPLGLLLNFNVLMLRDGIVRRAQTHSKASWCDSEGRSHGVDDLSGKIVAAAVEVRRWLGPGLLRSAYENCLVHELRLQGVPVAQAIPAQVMYRGQSIPSHKPLPLVINGELLVSCHCANDLSPLALARDRSLLRAAGVPVGLSINFHAPYLSAGVRRHSTIR
jgi:GxxExxY protein